MTMKKITEVFGVPENTLINWKKNRPQYLSYLEKGLVFLEILPNEVIEELMAAEKAKQINAILGIEATFPAKVMNITPSTVTAWMANGRNKLYIGLVAGSILDNLVPLLEDNNKTLDDLVARGYQLNDLVFSWRHRPTLFQAIIRE